MFLLRRSAARALSAAPSKAFIATPRSITTIAPLARARQQQQSLLSAFQRRFASDDATKTPDEFAQTAAEAPLEDGLTPAPANPTDASTTVGAEALDAAAEQQTSTSSERRAPFARSPKTPSPPSKVVYVGNLFYEVTAEQLTRIFSRFGEVENTRIIYDARGLSRGFGYVHFKSIDEAQAAVDNLDQQVFEGRNLVCQFNRPSSRTSSNTVERKVHASPPSTTLFIGNMSFDMSDKDLNDLFRDVQNVIDVRVAIDRRTGQPRGFAHADFVDVASATKAKAALAGKVIYGRDLRVDFSKSATKDRRSVKSDESTKSDES